MEIVIPGMIMLTWVWLYTLLPKCGMLTEKELAAMKVKMKKRMKLYVEDHDLIAWVLDDCLIGTGLTSIALRRVREIAANLFTKLYPESSIPAFSKPWIQYEKKDGKQAIICFHMCCC